MPWTWSVIRGAFKLLCNLAHVWGGIIRLSQYTTHISYVSHNYSTLIERSTRTWFQEFVSAYL